MIRGFRFGQSAALSYLVFALAYAVVVAILIAPGSVRTLLGPATGVQPTLLSAPAAAGLADE